MLLVAVLVGLEPVAVVVGGQVLEEGEQLGGEVAGSHGGRLTRPVGAGKALGGDAMMSRPGIERAGVPLDRVNAAP